MTTEKKDGLAVSDAELEKLYAFADGELTALESQAMELKLSDPNSPIRREMELVNQTSIVLQSWFAAHSPARTSADVWPALSAALIRPELSVMRRFLNRTRDVFKPLTSLSESFGRFVMPAGATFAAAALAFTLLPATDANKGNTLGNLAKQPEPFSWQTASDSSTSSETGLRLSSPLRVSEGTQRSYHERLRQFEDVPLQISRAQSMQSSAITPQQVSSLSSPMSVMSPARNMSVGSQRVLKIPVQGLLNRDFVLGGLKAGVADISWIKSDRTVDLLAGSDPDAPPVIWVTNSKAVTP